MGQEEQQDREWATRAATAEDKWPRREVFAGRCHQSKRPRGKRILDSGQRIAERANWNDCHCNYRLSIAGSTGWRGHPSGLLGRQRPFPARLGPLTIHNRISATGSHFYMTIFGVSPAPPDGPTPSAHFFFRLPVMHHSRLQPVISTHFAGAPQRNYSKLHSSGL